MRILILILCFFVSTGLNAQVLWTKDGNAMWQLTEGQLASMDVKTGERTVVVTKSQLQPPGQSVPLQIQGFSFSEDQNLLLIYTNSARVWRRNTRGDYWLLNRKTGSLRQVGKSMPAQSLMFAKLSPDATKVAYVSDRNIYVEDVANGKIKALTSDGKDKLINGTFDWVYEEEFNLRDGFRWSNDSRQIAYWQVDARGTRNFYMINNTDSIYSRPVPVEYPKVGQPISKVRIGVVDVSSAKTTWMKIPGEADKNYVVRMEWTPGVGQLIVQQLDRKQQQSSIFSCSANSGEVSRIYTEKDDAWIDIQSSWADGYQDGGWDWLNGGKEFLWSSEKDGWRHLYRVGRDGSEKLLTKGEFDVMDIMNLDEKGGYVYYLASPGDATSSYLYRSKLDGSGTPQKMSPNEQVGTHSYNISPNTKFAYHQYSNVYQPTVSEMITLPDHRGLNDRELVREAMSRTDSSSMNFSFFKVKTADGVEMDAWMVKPDKFDPSKKYPILFFVYSEPAGANVMNRFGINRNRLYTGNLDEDGYIYVTMDNRGTPAHKGRAWRKSIYKKIGDVNIRDQAMGAKEILKLPYVDTSRVAVWGWSGGGSATLNLMFQYPDIYKTGISIAAVANQLTYDNIYQERYMGDPFESTEAYIKGSPKTYAKNLRGNLLYIHGTGDDNVHYQNAEILLNELIKYNKQFQFMAYPNRSHGISEGEGTNMHLRTLYTEYLRKYCAPGGR
jgi:dipeptidyl-peptidase-4